MSGHRSDDVRFLFGPDAGEAVRLCSNLVALLNSEKALIEMLILCGVTIHLQWILNAAI